MPLTCRTRATAHAPAGTLSGLLVSRSATKGTRIFRMHRDDELLRMMLQGEGPGKSCRLLEKRTGWAGRVVQALRRPETHAGGARADTIGPSPPFVPALQRAVISRLWVQHVLPGQPPPADVFASWHVHHKMLRRIGEVGKMGGTGGL